MARPLRIEYSGAIYHVTTRGNERSRIFRSDNDHNLFLMILQKVTERFHWLCHVYCLMDNHYHLVVETPEGNLSAGMRQLNGVYTQASNRINGRVGHIFQGRFSAMLVQKETHLMEACRYVVLNPVRAKVAKTPPRIGSGAAIVRRRGWRSRMDAWLWNGCWRSLMKTGRRLKESTVSSSGRESGKGRSGNK